MQQQQQYFDRKIEKFAGLMIEVINMKGSFKS